MRAKEMREKRKRDNMGKAGDKDKRKTEKRRNTDKTKECIGETKARMGGRGKN